MKHLYGGTFEIIDCEFHFLQNCINVCRDNLFTKMKYPNSCVPDIVKLVMIYDIALLVGL